MEKAKKFTDLIVWQKAHNLVLLTYKLSERFPKSEIYGLTSQLRRAAVSIPANIAEGFREKSKAEKLYYLNIAHSSLEECRYYFILAKDLGYGDTATLMGKLEEISKLLYSYANKISSNAT